MRAKRRQCLFLPKEKSKVTYKKEQKESKIFILLVLFIIIILGILIGISFAKYQSKVAGQTFASIAKPILEIRKE